MEKTKFNHHHRAKITEYLTDNFDYGNWVKFKNESTLRNVVGDKAFESIKERIENHWFSIVFQGFSGFGAPNIAPNSSKNRSDRFFSTLWPPSSGASKTIRTSGGLLLFDEGGEDMVRPMTMKTPSTLCLQSRTLKLL